MSHKLMPSSFPSSRLRSNPFVADAAPMKTERVTLLAHGQPFKASLSIEGEPKAGLVVMHEWYGLNDAMVALGEKFAREGYAVLVPDLYAGEVATDAARAGELMNRMMTERSMEIIEASVITLARRTQGKVGVTGFCLGGAMALAAATSVSGISAIALIFPVGKSANEYGLPKRSYLDASKVKCPIQAHFAAHDDWARADTIEAFASEVRALGKQMEVHVYEAGHAFMREGDADVYNAPCAATAWTRVNDFLARETNNQRLHTELA
jgi:carboxymethylenebutenolidase